MSDGTCSRFTNPAAPKQLFLGNRGCRRHPRSVEATRFNQLKPGLSRSSVMRYNEVPTSARKLSAGDSHNRRTEVRNPSDRPSPAKVAARGDGRKNDCVRRKHEAGGPTYLRGPDTNCTRWVRTFPEVDRPALQPLRCKLVFRSMHRRGTFGELPPE